jgi:aspartate oxidase
LSANSTYEVTADPLAAAVDAGVGRLADGGYLLRGENLVDGNGRERGGDYDLAVVGGGVAGLTAALTAASEGARVMVLTKGHVLASASYEAQGGVAAAVGPGDSPAHHAEDTIAVGRRLCRESAVHVLTSEAPARIDELRAYGVHFDSGLGLEGGHSERRVLHVNGAETGRRIAEALAQEALANGSIEVVERDRVVAVSPGEGLETASRALRAGAVLLATGGYAAIWSRTTNPPGSTGEGIELAYRAGAAIADLEFVQFHPTALEGGRFLLSEALRGEGALLVDEEGHRFTDELAPRDVVARAVAERPIWTVAPTWPGCTRRESAPAPASTAPTGSLPTPSSNASSSVVGRRSPRSGILFRPALSPPLPGAAAS